MAKRFTDSGKFRDNWYRKLSPKHKCLWEYMLAECSIAGILEVDCDAMSFHIGDEITPEDVSILAIKFHWLTEEKIFIPNFIKFQQKELSENNKAHKNIIQTLEEYGIPLSLDMTDFQSPIEGASKPLSRGTGIGIGKSISKGKNKKSLNMENNKGLKPDEICDDLWNDFLKVRKAKKAPMTETALKLLISQAKKANWTLEEALQECVARNWQTFKAEWVKHKPPAERETSLNKLLMEGRYDEIPEC